MKLNNDIIIKKYSDKYAAKVADMWNKSSGGWNGEEFNETEEKIISKHKSMTYLDVYLALYENDVVGYCMISEDNLEENVLYIDLLNVRTDMHGKRVGKTLLVKSIERTVELGYRRLDLHTWSGNLKAVPLYKKCGFMWQKKENSVHLINFIPYLFTSDLLKSYIGKFDWYDDLIRDIEVKPDGVIDNGFELYEYKWDNGSDLLRVVFNRRTGGLQEIETNDFMIKAVVEKISNIYGQSYDINYEITNYSDDILSTVLKGKSSGIIDFNFEDKFKIDDKKVLNKQFYINEIEYEYDKDSKLPELMTEIEINNCTEMFRIGVDPKIPLKTKLCSVEKLCKKNKNNTLYLDMKNNFDALAKFCFNLVDNDSLKFEKKRFEIELKPYEKKSIELMAFIQNGCFYNEKIRLDVKFKNSGKKQNYTVFLKGIIPTHDSKFYAKTLSKHVIYNGRYKLEINRRNYSNCGELKDILNDNLYLYLTEPSFGKPFNKEFMKISSENPGVMIDEDSIILKSNMKSREYEGMEIGINLKLYNSGKLERWYSVINKSSRDIEDLYVRECVITNYNNTYIPYNNKIIKINDDLENSYKLHNISSADITGNWLFRKKKNKTVSVKWPENVRVDTTYRRIILIHEYGKMKKNETVNTEAVEFTLNYYNNIKNFVKDNKLAGDNYEHTNVIDIKVNSNNNVVDKNFDIAIQNYILDYDNVEYKIKSEKNLFKTFSLNSNDSKKKVKIEKKSGGLDILDLSMITDSEKKRRKKLILIKSDKKVKKLEEKNEERKEFLIDNGVVEFKAASNFAPLLISLKFKGNEWLDSSYPDFISKSWWNPWAGGIITSLPDKNIIYSYRRDYEIDFIKIKDNKKNIWEGFDIRSIIESSEKFNGLIIHDMYLTLPGVPLLLKQTYIEQKTGSIIKNEGFENTMFFTADKLKNLELSMKNNLGLESIFYAGRAMQNIGLEDLVVLKAKNRKERLNVYLPGSYKPFAFTNSTTAGIIKNDIMTVKSKSKRYFNPVFFLFEEKKLNINSIVMRDFKNIKFKI